MKKSLKSFARKQAEEEKKETTAPEVKGKKAKKEEEETPEEDSEEEEITIEEEESSEEETTDESAEVPEELADEVDEVETGNQASNTLQPGHISINASELQKLQKDASLWRKNKTQFATLSAWYENTVKAGIEAKEDETTRSQEDSVKATVLSKPWNQKAQGKK
ncbi:hypothetical protein BWI97_08755 [Siphonobacter sp. BAB-5405]|uniref:hypothetical protein n=1 Tax=Siphonobacter sp. BAB-5405 TaxID=1864825 RepID=UPI000C7FFB26|nr:hypothetical protein [Siphonobacter sp. BAB-5405]PMD97689.1 hypothetical protein BWI97_08755 [Siphonobacter sp. BAB-5405]